MKITFQFPEIPLYHAIINQLEILKILLLERIYSTSREELLEKYSFGLIVAKNFDDTVYGNNLMFVYGMSNKYYTLPED